MYGKNKVEEIFGGKLYRKGHNSKKLDLLSSQDKEPSTTISPIITVQSPYFLTYIRQQRYLDLPAGLPAVIRNTELWNKVKNHRSGEQ